MLLLLLAFTWTELTPGIELAELDALQESSVGDSKIRVVRVDPARHEMVLATGKWRTAKEWAAAEHLAVVINPGMFHSDARSTGRMQIGNAAVNPVWNRDKHLLAITPLNKGLPTVQIADASCQDLAATAEKYRSFVQSIRMLSCTGSNVWTQSRRIWSHAVYGVDKQGRMLFIHARSPWSTHDFIEQLRALPLDIDRLTYGEGGPEASLYVHVGDFEAEWYGSYETGFNEDDENKRAWPIPNVLGVKAR